MSITGTLNPTSVEAVGVFYAASFCQEIGIQDLVLEGDTLLVVKAVSSTEVDRTRFGHIVADTYRVLKSPSRWQCCYVSRDANIVAHKLANVAKHHFIDKVWMKKSHECICNIILMEQSALFFY